MTDTPTRTAFAERDGGRGSAWKTRRTDFADAHVRVSDQAQLLQRIAMHVADGTTDLSDREMFVGASHCLDRNSFGDPGPVVNNLMVADTWGWHGRETMCPQALKDAVLADAVTGDESMGIGYFLYPNAILIVSEIHQEMFRIYPGGEPGTSYLYQTYATYNDSAFVDDEETNTMVYDAIRFALVEEDVPMAGSIQHKLDRR
jgi:hypothetical protein